MRVYLHGQLVSLKEDQLPVLSRLFDLIENAINGRIEATNLADGAVTTTKLAAAAVTSAKVAEGVGLVASGQYTGSGTPDREIAVGFRPKYVQVLRHDTSVVFEALGGVSGAFAAFWRTSVGNLNSGAADWQGITANGFKVGSGAAGGLSDASGQTFSWIAYR